MTKKIWYSSPLNYYWKELYGTQKKYTPNLSNEQIFLLLRNNILKAPYPKGESYESRGLVLSGLDLWREDAMGDFLHIFFLEKQLRDFLEETPLSDLEGIRKYLYEFGENKDVVFVMTNIQSNAVVYNFGLHIPYEKNGYAFSLSLERDNSIELYFSQKDQGGRMSDKFYNDLIKKKDNKSIALCRMFRLAINAIAYMNCFPECVTEGVPKITKDRNEARSDRNVIFNLSEKITDIENTPKSKIPHFRKGFFRVLRSDYYTHKQGQIIYVTETMVKGKAMTVETSPRKNEFVDRSEEKSER